MKPLRSEQVLAFVAATFRSAWQLELLCLLRSKPERSWRPEELVRDLSASRLVVEQSVAALVALDLVSVDGEGAVRYDAPDHLAGLMTAIVEHYRRSPDAMRRAIARGNSRSLDAFADAFRLRSDE